MTSPASDTTIAREFVQFALEAGVLRFGEFKTKAGRLSPYFFNSGLFDDGVKLMRLGEFYARRLAASGLAFDMLFGPAYKGITLSAAVAIEFGRRGRAVPFAYNRKEAKDHGEGGLVVGAPLRGRTVIVDDVITDGASKRESVELLRREGAEPVAVLIALDRMERGGSGDNLSERSAVEDFERDYGMPVIPVATVADLMEFLDFPCRPAACRPRRCRRRLPAALRRLRRRASARGRRAAARGCWRSRRLGRARRASRRGRPIYPVRAERQEGHLRPADPRVRPTRSSASSIPTAR